MSNNNENKPPVLKVAPQKPENIEKNDPVLDNPMFQPTPPDEFLKELSQDREEFAEAEEVEPAADTDKADDTPEKPTSEEKPGIKRKVGKTMFTTLDVSITTGVSWLAGVDTADIRLGKEEKEELILAWEDLADTYDWKKPPAWFVITLLMSFGYGGMISKAAKLRKEKKKKQAQPQKPRQESPGNTDQKVKTMIPASVLEEINTDVKIPAKKGSKQFSVYENQLREELLRQKEEMTKLKNLIQK